jgi:hypothetical protein
MTAIVTPLRLDRMQRALFDVLSEATDTDVHWGYTEPTQEQLADSFVELHIIAGPGPFIRAGSRGRTIRAIDTVPLTVTSVVVDAWYIIRLNGFDYRTAGVSGDTVTDIRDRLVTAIEVDTLETATATTSGADTLDLTADSVGGIWSLELVGALSAGTVTYSSGNVLVTEGTQTMLVNVQAFSKSQEPRNGASMLIQQCMAALQSPDLVETFTRYGVGVWGKTNPVDLSAIAGAYWETRASMDITLAVRAIWTRPVETIETVSATLDTTDAGGASLDSTDITVNAP